MTTLTLLLALAAAPPTHVMWDHSGDRVTHFVLCVDDDCEEVALDRARTAPGVWSVPAPRALGDGADHLVTVQACRRLRRGEDLCSKPAAVRYRR